MAAHGRQHAGEHPALHVVQRVRLFAAGMHERVFVACDPLHHAQVEQGAAHRHQFTPLVRRAEREAEAGSRERRFGGELQQALAQQPQRDLRVGAFEHRTGQTEQHIPAAIVEGKPRVVLARSAGSL